MKRAEAMGRPFYEMPFDEIAKRLWPYGPRGATYHYDRPLLAAARAYLEAKRAGGQDGQAGLGSFIAERAWDVVFGRREDGAAFTPLHAYEAVRGSVEPYGFKMHDGATPDAVTCAARQPRSDTTPLTRACRVYNELARDLPVTPRADRRDAPRGPLRKLLVGIGARRGDQGCRAEIERLTRPLKLAALRENLGELADNRTPLSEACRNGKAERG